MCLTNLGLALTRLGLLHAHKAGLLPWGSLPLNVQIGAIKAGAAAAWHAYVPTVAPGHLAYNLVSVLATGGHNLSHTQLPTVAPAAAAPAAAAPGVQARTATGVL